MPLNKETKPNQPRGGGTFSEEVLHEIKELAKRVVSDDGFYFES